MKDVKKPKIFGAKKGKKNSLRAEVPMKTGTRASRRRKSKLDTMHIGDFIKGRNTGAF